MRRPRRRLLGTTLVPASRPRRDYLRREPAVQLARSPLGSSDSRSSARTPLVSSLLLPPPLPLLLLFLELLLGPDKGLSMPPSRDRSPARLSRLWRLIADGVDVVSSSSRADPRHAEVTIAILRRILPATTCTGRACSALTGGNAGSPYINGRRGHLRSRRRSGGTHCQVTLREISLIFTAVFGKATYAILRMVRLRGQENILAWIARQFFCRGWSRKNRVEPTSAWVGMASYHTTFRTLICIWGSKRLLCG